MKMLTTLFGIISIQHMFQLEKLEKKKNMFKT